MGMCGMTGPVVCFRRRYVYAFLRSAAISASMRRGAARLREDSSRSWLFGFFETHAGPVTFIGREDDPFALQCRAYLSRYAARDVISGLKRGRGSRRDVCGYGNLTRCPAEGRSRHPALCWRHDVGPGFRNRTPAPPPFSGMKSTPAASRAIRMAARLLRFGVRFPFSKSATVFLEMEAREASSA